MLIRDNINVVYFAQLLGTVRTQNSILTGTFETQNICREQTCLKKV